MPWGLAIAAAAAVVVGAGLFRTWRARLTAVLTLAPLAVVAAALLHFGQQERAEESVVQSDPTVFGDGSHEPGSSHAAGPAVEAPKAEGGSELDRALAGAMGAEGLTWPDKGTRYTVSTLWNRIDGAAEHYKQHGLRGAIFATARTGEIDVEVQLFDMGTSEKALGLFDATDRADEVTPLTAGDRGVLWPGGGEVVTGPIYARVVVSAVPDDPAAEAAPRALLEAMVAGGSPGEVAEPKEEPEAIAAPAEAEPSLTSALGIGEHLVDFYGIEDAEVRGEAGSTVKVVRLRSGYAAAAWAGTLDPGDGEAAGDFGFDADRASARVRGARVIWAEGDGAAARADDAAADFEAEALPGAAALSDATERRVQVGGWSGRGYLGGVLIGTLADESEAFVARPEDAEEAFATLIESFPEHEQREGVVVAADPYQGEVALARKGDLIVGVAGAESADAALAHLTRMVSRLP